MGGLDDAIASVGEGGSLLVVLLVAVLLGLRHATDPDHLTAVSTLIVADERHGTARARRLGLAWGAGHATTLFAFGLPVVLFGAQLPEIVQRLAEGAIGAIIVVLAVRLLARWHAGAFHTHAHRHGAVVHAHPHVHEHGVAVPHPHAHKHPHAEDLGRTPLTAYGIGLVHGLGGSAGVGLLLLGGISGHVAGAAALLLFAAATAVSMALVSSAFGYALARGPVAGRLGALAPVLGTCGLLFGAWYALGAL
jgi:ABC-type nickel/cobalt efflux system permease component RcnA